MQEEFRVIKGFENYFVSNLGNIKNNSTGRILKPGINKGYYQVHLSNNGEVKTKLVHRLVGEAFPNPLNKKYIDHIDNNRLNNNINNLRWATPSENSFNQKLSSVNTSGNKGVSFHKRDKKWYAKIKINGKKIHLGNFDSKDEAIKARVNKAKELFGGFINTCEEIKIEINEIKSQKQKEIEELEALEKEFEELVKKHKSC
jgi:hypothetical protein